MKSSLPLCPVAVHELYYFNKTRAQEMKYTNATVLVNFTTGKLTFNTSQSANETIIMRVNTKFGLKPIDFTILVEVVGKPSFVFNAAPFLSEPPEGVNLVATRDKKVYTAILKLG